MIPLHLVNELRGTSPFQARCWMKMLEKYRVFQANTPIKNRHFSDSDKAREILKTVQSSYMNPILYVTSFMIPNGYYDGQMQ